MKKATVTYNAPEGEAKVIEWLGATLYSGVATDVICDDGAMERLQANQYFDVSGVTDHKPEEASKGGASKEGPKTADHHKEAHRR